MAFLCTSTVARHQVVRLKIYVHMRAARTETISIEDADIPNIQGHSSIKSIVLHTILNAHLRQMRPIQYSYSVPLLSR